MKSVIFTTVTIIIVVALLPLLLIFGLKYIPAKYQDPTVLSKPIYEKLVIEGEVSASRNYFSGLAVSVKNANLQNKKDVVLSLTDKNGNEIRKSILNGAVIPDGEYMKFMFDPINNSNGVTYKYIFSSPDSNEKNAVEIYLNKDKRVAFVDLYKPSRFNLIKSIYTGWFNKIIGDRIFTGVYLITLLGLLFVVLRKSN